ncbi:uncharacterized protein Bfra_003501 [Botrytis fragariae]|uniref:Uncharacterized protein n=1 Tax=Botrytis fragariae TaxID=1964551 RepID=A0A8H6AWF3_9HELO|nr:uncharacterized protein Bfra_003501 [Botrytis fragariae]KAF5875048.1 hypothetical protein Bfra_003501 [Botrytis fragariae]
MAPKAQRVVVERSGRRPAQPKGYFASTYTALTAPENASVVRICKELLRLVKEMRMVWEWNVDLWNRREKQKSDDDERGDPFNDDNNVQWIRSQMNTAVSGGNV